SIRRQRGDPGAQEAIAGFLRQFLENLIWILEMVQNTQKKREPVVRLREVQALVDIGGLDLQARAQRLLQHVNAEHGVVVGGWIIDGSNGVPQRLEKERHITVAAADVKNRVGAGQFTESLHISVQKLVESQNRCHRVVRVPLPGAQANAAFDLGQ